MVVNVDDPPDGDKADVANIGGCGKDDSERIDNRQEELLPTTEVLMHIIRKEKNRNKYGHWCEDNADGQTAKDDMAVFDQPPTVQDVADEVEQRECQLCDRSL